MYEGEYRVVYRKVNLQSALVMQLYPRGNDAAVFFTEKLNT